MKKILILSLLTHSLYADVASIATIGEGVDALGGLVSTADAVTGGIFSVMNHGEIEYGRGNITLDASMIGLSGKIGDDVTTYTLKNEHHATPIKHLNYNYKISWYESQKMNQAVSTYNEYVNDFNGYTGDALSIPSLNYRIRGLDADVGVGWDIIDISPRDYFSIGADVGLSLPTIESTLASQSSSSSSSEGSSASVFDASNTTITTYKVGMQMRVSKSLSTNISLYASSIFAYQTARLQNDTINLDIYTDGIFNENELGIRFQLLEYKQELTSWFALKPELFFTAGVRYSTWTLDSVAVNLFDYALPLPESDFQVNATTIYAGIGYSF